MIFIDYKNFFYHPANNLICSEIWGQNSEYEFGNIFARQLYGNSNDNIISFRELPVPGAGIADFVVIRQKLNHRINGKNISVRVFEFKLTNWRKGLMQAHRYKYFANSSILVIPIQKMKSAQNSLDIFKRLGIGLWAFDVHSNKIKKMYTPHSRKIHNKRHSDYLQRVAVEAHSLNYDRSL